VWTLRRISDITHFLGDRAYTHSTPEATVIENQEVSQSIPEAPRTLTFAELQSLIEQGKMDEIPNNKHIPDTINVVLISYSILSFLAHNAHTGGRTQSVERPATQKALGGPIAFGMTSEARDWHHGVKAWRLRTLQLVHDQFRPRAQNKCQT
jgi:hypothetical protein